jgi:hypothetical protein
MVQRRKRWEITRLWLDKYQARVQLSPVHTEHEVDTSFINGSASGMLSMQLGLSGELGKLVSTRLTEG